MAQEHKYNNLLLNEQSLYLQLHAHNPVNWYPWGNEAFDKAKTEDKLVILSIGYASCHWCHVMEHESFADLAVAQSMNDNYISVKIDREERPDIDQVYMDVAQLLSGRGGWPLNVIALPDGRPIFAGTYFTKEQWLHILAYVSKLYKEKKEEIIKQADGLAQNLQSLHLGFIREDYGAAFDAKLLDLAFNNCIKQIDFEHGGQRGAPKFPMPVVYEFLLHYYHYSKSTQTLDAVNCTLYNMAMGGIYDHIGGGFARYSTDEVWKVPHFEKMLYDNAQLVSLYAHTYRLTKNKLYKQVVFETLHFLEQEMKSPEGVFYSAIDADSEGIEGSYYVWKYDEIAKIAGSKTVLITDYYNVTKAGNWEQDKNILYRSVTDKKIQQKYNVTPADVEELIPEIKKKLLQERKKRVKPLTDDKFICSWNALMIKAYADAYKAFCKNEHLNAAVAIGEFIYTELIDTNSRIYRNYKNGKKYGTGFLDDYALTIYAFVALYQITFDESWLKKAVVLTDYTLIHFCEKETGLFYYTSDADDPLLVRKIEIPDNVIASGNSVMATNLYLLGVYYENKDYTKQAEQMLKNVMHNLPNTTWYFANWAKLYCYVVAPPHEVAIIGNNYLDINQQLNKYFIPHVLVMGSKNESNLPLLKNRYVENQTTIYVCQNKTCQLPVTNLNDALAQLNVI
jgi:uncharacterized protein